ncbi:hypothetical protein RRG08_028983 [Elysia crispata]|uniref:Uncharacterized protein n=1 Tax=Elysia crispata TaxID=231223 RepID=A0AAE1BDF5_9GAST|nr:hypothetical protein RRG08_028983 [Elysia crispata]
MTTESMGRSYRRVNDRKVRVKHQSEPGGRVTGSDKPQLAREENGSAGNRFNRFSGSLRFSQTSQELRNVKKSDGFSVQGYGLDFNGLPRDW